MTGILDAWWISALALTALGCGVILTVRPEVAWRLWSLMRGTYASSVPPLLLLHWWPAAGCGLTGIVVMWLIGRCGPPRRKRARRVLGAKGRAVIAALVRVMRRRPRPVLRPAPGGTS